MSRKFRLTIGIAVALPLLAVAQARQPDATNPESAGFPTVYRSAFAGYRPMQEPAEPSIERWRSVNDEVARVGGHAGAIKDSPRAEASDSGTGEAKPSAMPSHHQH